MIEEQEVRAVAMSGDAVFVGGPREVVMTTDHMNWYAWHCPLEEVVGLDVKDNLLVVVGDGQMAASMINHQGRLWQVVEVKGQPTCVVILPQDRVAVGTSDGRLFEFKIKVPRRFLDRLRLSRCAPIIESGHENVLVGG